MLVAQLGSSSRTAWLLLAAYVMAALVFGLLWALQGDWVAALFCLAASAGAARMGLVLRRRSGLEANATHVASGRASAITPNGQLFVSFARYMVGARMRPGLLLIGPSSAAFVPVGGWTHLAVELAVVVFAARFRFIDLALYVPREGDLELALQDAVQRHDGFIIDDTWTYTASQRWLSRPDAQGLVWIERRPPDAFTSRWAATAVRSPAEFREIRNRIAGGAAIVAAVLALAGIVAWRVTGDAQYLIAGLAYAALLGGAVIGGLVVAERRLTTTPRP